MATKDETMRTATASQLSIVSTVDEHGRPVEITVIGTPEDAPSAALPVPTGAPGFPPGKMARATAVVAAFNVGRSTPVASSCTWGPSGLRSRNRTVTAGFGPTGI